MNAQLADSGAAINRFLLHVHPLSRDTVNVYRCILVEFQSFVQVNPNGIAICQSSIEAWLRGCALRWPEHYVLHRARVVDRFLDFLAIEESIPSNPLAQLRLTYGQRAGTPIVRALLSPDPAQALEALKPLPQFASVHGAFMRTHVELMRASGYRYNTQASSFLRFDRFLQSRGDLLNRPWRSYCSNGLPRARHCIMRWSASRLLVISPEPCSVSTHPMHCPRWIDTCLVNG